MNKKVVVFYTHSARAFRNTLIGYFYELVQVYDVILVSEKLDLEIELLLKNEALFPNLVNIIPVDQFSQKTIWASLKYNNKLAKLSRDIIIDYNPWLVVVGSDMHSLFEMYLCRRAKSNGAFVVSIQPSTILANVTSSHWVDLLNANKLSGKKWGLSVFNLKAAQIRKRLGHILMHWIFPVLAFEKPLLGKSSYILRKGGAGMRDSDCHVVFCDDDKQEYLKDGVDSQKLQVFAHPLLRSPTKKIMLEAFGIGRYTTLNSKKNKYSKKVALILLPCNEVGFRKNDFSLIAELEYKESRLDIISTIYHALDSWHIKLKPHPVFIDHSGIISEVVKQFPSLELLQAHEPIEPHLMGQCHLVIDLPRAASSVLETAAWLNIPAIAVDIHEEFTGNIFENKLGITYVHDMNGLELSLKNVLKQPRMKKQVDGLLDIFSDFVANKFSLK